MRRNSNPRNFAIAPSDPLLPHGIVHIDKTLDTYRTLKFDENGIKRAQKGPSIAQQYEKQAVKMASIKK
jgi:hypothetical protein